MFLTLEKNQTIVINRIFKSELNIKRVVIPISSASGPEIIIAKGETNVTIVITFDMTLPCFSGGITVCRIVKNMVLTNGTINAKIKPPILITMKFCDGAKDNIKCPISPTKMPRKIINIFFFQTFLITTILAPTNMPAWIEARTMAVFSTVPKCVTST